MRNARLGWRPRPPIYVRRPADWAGHQTGVRFRRHSRRQEPAWHTIRQTWPTQGSISLARYTTLLKQRFASAQQVTDQASTVTQLEVSVAGDKAAIFNAQTRLGYTTITSPIDGVTGIRNVDIVGLSIAVGFVVDDAIVTGRRGGEDLT
jgi:multidrug efflux pump subunit AcrA (membrane-fusion protein)